MISTNQSGAIKQLVQGLESNWITSLTAIDSDTVAYNLRIKKILTLPKPVLQYKYVAVFFNYPGQTSHNMSYGESIPFITIPTNYFQNASNKSPVDDYFDSDRPQRPYVRTDGPAISWMDFYWPYEKGTHDENTILWLAISGSADGAYEIVTIG